MKIASFFKFIVSTLMAAMLAACSLPANVTISTCQFMPGDSYINGFGNLIRNLGHPGARYGLMTLPRRRLLNGPSGSDFITIDYMVHETGGGSSHQAVSVQIN